MSGTAKPGRAKDGRAKDGRAKDGRAGSGTEHKAARAVRAGTADHILDAAAHVFNALGYSRTTIEEIARAAECTRPTVYSYFSSKDEIFRQLAERVRDQFSAAQRVPAGLPPDQIVRLTDIGYLRAYTENLGLLTIIQHQSLSEPDMQSLWADMHTRINHAHVRFMKDLDAEGEASPATSLLSIADAVNGVVMRFAQIIVQDESRADSLSNDLVLLHLRMLGRG